MLLIGALYVGDDDSDDCDGGRLDDWFRCWFVVHGMVEGLAIRWVLYVVLLVVGVNVGERYLKNFSAKLEVNRKWTGRCTESEPRVRRNKKKYFP